MFWNFVGPYLEACIALNTRKCIFILIFHVIPWLHFGGHDKNSHLSKIPDAEEIHRAAFELKRESSLGPGGFSGHFFYATWHIIGSIVVKPVKHFLKSGKLCKASNTFFITLIPKNHSPSSFVDFKPISLLNFTYKITAKILTSRLAKVLNSLISPNQDAFVKDRSIHQHIALAHELFQKLNSKLKGGSLCMQLDISKAFDRLSWPFLFKSLHFFGLSDSWISLIRECICTAKGLISPHQ